MKKRLIDVGREILLWTNENNPLYFHDCEITLNFLEIVRKIPMVKNEKQAFSTAFSLCSSTTLQN